MRPVFFYSLSLSQVEGSSTERKVRWALTKEDVKTGQGKEQDMPSLVTRAVQIHEEYDFILPPFLHTRRSLPQLFRE